MTIRTLTRRTALAVVAGAASLVLAACGADGGDGGAHAAHGGSAATGAAGAGAHNAQDVAFAQGMIPHHRQALEMARLAADRASSPEVKDLAARVEKAQAPEIRTMTGWLKGWHEQVPTAGTGHSGHTSQDRMAGMPGMDHTSHGGASGTTRTPGATGMPGMMGDDDMAALKKATGRDFDTRFLSLMVEHHQGAVAMAATERGKGAYGPARRAAADITTAQNAEIAEMRRLLGESTG
ncbi:DUF305 domain-containing protein [Streptomyces collinus]|uniref:DUF305 domain-containing protein n=1 Tax=Streptomyces collinus TaxID=42684 RepID=UPI003635FFFC